MSLSNGLTWAVPQRYTKPIKIYYKMNHYYSCCTISTKLFPFFRGTKMSKRTFPFMVGAVQSFHKMFSLRKDCGADSEVYQNLWQFSCDWCRVGRSHGPAVGLDPVSSSQNKSIVFKGLSVCYFPISVSNSCYSIKLVKPWKRRY